MGKNEIHQAFFLDGERFITKNYKHLTNSTNTHSPTDSVRGDDLTNHPLITKPRDHSPTIYITGPSLCKASEDIDILNGQMEAMSVNHKRV